MPLFAIASVCASMVGVLLRLFVVVIPSNVNAHEVVTVADASANASGAGAGASGKDASDKEAKANASFFDGLRLIATHRYLLMLLLISTLYEVIATITDYQMKVLAHDAVNVRLSWSRFGARRLTASCWRRATPLA